VKAKSIAPSVHDKCLTPREAIRAFCHWCNGGNPASCAYSVCSLYNYRSSKALPGGNGSPLRAIRFRCLDCAGTNEAVRSCNVSRFFTITQTECPLWPHREGQRHASARYRAERRKQESKQRRETVQGATFAPMLLIDEVGRV